MIPLIVVLLMGLIPPPPQAVWEWPTSGDHLIIRDFTAPLTPWGAGHRGLDLAAEDSDIVAPTGGTISFSGWVVNRGVLTITTPEGMLISMEPVTPAIESGEQVRRGQVIARVEPGHCATPCLHLGLRVGTEYRSPRRELGVLQRARLLPWDPSG